MERLNYETKKTGDPIDHEEWNNSMEKINSLVDWVNNREAMSSTAFSIANATIIGLEGYFEYAGYPVVPGIKVYSPEGKLLVQGISYDYAISNNNEVGTALVTFYGIGEYTGTVQKTFSIQGKKYTVTFVDEEKGTATSTLKISVLSTSDIPTPTYDNCTLVGWYTERNGQGTKLTAQTLTSDITVYAHWQQSTWQITYNMNGHGDAQEVVSASELTDEILAAPTADDYTFGGWFTDSALTKEAVAGTTLTKNITLYAKWTATLYKVTYRAVGRTADDTTENLENLPTTLADPTAVEGYWFIGWFADAACTTAYSTIAGNKLHDDNTIVYGKWIDTDYYGEMNITQSKLSFVKEETDANAKIQVSKDDAAYVDYADEISLDSTSKYKSKLVYGTHESDTATIQMEYDSDSNAIKFTSTSGADVTVTAESGSATIASNVVSDASSLVSGTVLKATDGTSTAILEIIDEE